MKIGDWPAVYKNLLIVGNPESNVAICTLWSEKNRIAHQLDKERFAVCGNLYSMSGINSILKNIFANPKIRFLVIFGNDLTRTGEMLLRLSKDGIDGNHCIAGTEIKIDKEIGKNDIDLLRESVRLVDLRKQNIQQLINNVNELNKNLPAFSEPKYFAETEQEFSTLPSENSGFVVRKKTIGSAWLRILDLIMKFGIEKESEYGLKQKEILNLVSVIESDSKIEKYFDFDENDLETYYKSLLAPEKPDGVAYTYGERLFKNNQIENAIERLKKKPHTRRSVAVVLKSDDMSSENPPCLTMVIWNIQNKKLFQTAHFRSQDMFAGYPMNLFGLKKLQENAADKIGIECGHVTCITTSAHLYENNWAEAEKIILENTNIFDIRQLTIDPRGSFVIVTDKNKIIVEHFTRDGQKTQFRFEGDDPEKLYKEIAASGLVSRLDHAAYLGYELLRASMCIKSGKKFVQDE